MAAIRVGMAQSNVSIPSSTPADQVVDLADPEQVSWTVLGQLLRRPAHDLVHLGLVLAERAADRYPVAAAGGHRLRRLRRRSS